MNKWLISVADPVEFVGIVDGKTHPLAGHLSRLKEARGNLDSTLKPKQDMKIRVPAFKAHGRGLARMALKAFLYMYFG